MCAARRKDRLSGAFVAIIAFKYFKGLLSLLVGVGALRLLGRSEMPSATDVARFFGLAPENLLVHRLAAILGSVTPHKAVAIGAAALFVGAVLLIEATLLVFRIWWSTYLMIGLTSLGLPFEIYEIFREPTKLRRWLVLLINVAILAYLWWRRNEFRSSKR
jgi:uncharacterized membrane protein (DUF2068 family)